MKQSRIRKVYKRLGKRSVIAFLVSFCIFLSLTLWTALAERHAHYAPKGIKADITPLLSESELTASDYQLLLSQTGMNRAAVDYLYANSRQHELIELQELYWAEVHIKCEQNTIVTWEERLETVSLPTGDIGHVSIPCLEEGDILITFSCHTLGFRNGHAAIVVDGADRLVLEAQKPGTNSIVRSVAHWESYPAFAVLRLKAASRERRAEIAAYAADNLADIPYWLGAGIGERARSLLEGKGSGERQQKNAKQEEKPAASSGTQCAHLIWSAYRQFGYDLDSDGGILVTPGDLFDSPDLEIVQIYGMPLF